MDQRAGVEPGPGDSRARFFGGQGFELTATRVAERDHRWAPAIYASTSANAHGGRVKRLVVQPEARSNSKLLRP